jgi:hypothetical protein
MTERTEKEQRRPQPPQPPPTTPPTPKTIQDSLSSLANHRTNTKQQSPSSISPTQNQSTRKGISAKLNSQPVNHKNGICEWKAYERIEGGREGRQDERGEGCAKE